MRPPSKSLVIAVLAGVVAVACQATQPASPPPRQGQGEGGRETRPPQTHPPERPPAAADRIAIVQAISSDGDKVTADTVLNAQLDYAVQDFARDKFIVMTQVETTSQDVTTSGGFPAVAVDKASGRLVVKFPLRYVWNLPEVKFPLIVHFNLNEKLAGGGSSPIATSQPITFDAADGRVSPPTDPKRVAYEAALVQVEGVFASVQQERDLCAERYPQLSPTIRDAYSKWIDRNARVREEVERREQQQMQATSHDADVEKFRKARAALIRDMLSSASADTIESRCRLYADNLASPRLSFNEDLAEPWTTIRAYKHPGGDRSFATDQRRRPNAVTSEAPASRPQAASPRS
jgi:hypothetical protein